MDLRYGSGAESNHFDLRGWMLKLSGSVQNQKVIILKSDIKLATEVLLHSQVKGNFIEKHFASPAWLPIISIESTDGEEWEDLIANFRYIFKKTEWEKRISPIIADHLYDIKERFYKIKLQNFKHLELNHVFDAEAMSRLILSIFFQLIFNEKIKKNDEDLFYSASLEWRKEIAIKGKGNQQIKRKFWERLSMLIKQNNFLPCTVLAKSERSQILLISSFAQPFFISPQINFADIFASIGHIFKINNEIYLMALKMKNNLPFLRGLIFEGMRLYHPFPILERELTISMKIKGTNYPIGTQVFIMLDEFKQDPEINPESWINHQNEFAPLLFGTGPRSCPGRQLAERISVEILSGLLEIPRKCFQPDLNLKYSGRINDKNQKIGTNFYQIRTFSHFLIKTWFKQHFNGA